MNNQSLNLMLLHRSEEMPGPIPVVAVALRPDSEPWYLLEHALDWAQKLNARLDLCSVLPGVEGVLSLPEFTPLQYRHLKRKRQEVRRWLNGLMATIPAHCRGNVALLEGEPGSAIAKYAHSHALLVLGRSQPRGFFSIFERSVTTKLAQSCTIPIAIVRGRRRLRSDMVAMLPVLPVMPEQEATEWMAEHLPDSNLTTVHVTHDNEGAETSMLASLSITSGRCSEIHVRALTSHGVGRVVAKHAKYLDADLVAVPASRRTGLLQWLFGSAVDGLLQNSHCSVLVVPAVL